MKRVGVLHDEFARANDTEAGPYLIAYLGLNLIEVQRELFVTSDLIAHQSRDDFLVSGAEAEVAIVTVANAQQFRPVLRPAAGFLPQLGGLHNGHTDFLRSAALHFLAHNRFHFAHHAQAQRQPGIQAGGQFANEAGSQHELVADDLCIRRRFFLGGD